MNINEQEINTTKTIISDVKVWRSITRITFVLLHMPKDFASRGTFEHIPINMSFIC